MRWAWSEALVATFDKKYGNLFERLGCSVNKKERIIRHVGGMEREVIIVIQWKGTWLSHSLQIREINSREGKWVIVGVGRDTVSRKLDEKIWRAFYAGCNLLVAKVIQDIAHSFGVFPTANFSLQRD
jgi:hypothetical protein